MNIIIRKASIRSSLFLNYEFEQKDIDHLKREVLAYMEGKHAERAQLQMFNEEEEEEEQETPEPKAKGPKAKKNNSAFAD